MNTQMGRPKAHITGHDQDEPLHYSGIRPGEGHQETEHHDEKKSVLKKVKAKAKKIKDTVTGHHGNHDHDHDHDHEDDEMEADHEVHGVPSGHSFAPGLDQEVAGLKGTNTASERTTATLPTSKPAYFETFDPAVPGRPMAISEPGEYQTFDPSRARYVPGQRDILGHSRTDTGRPMPPSKPGDYQTLDPSTTRYVPGQEDILGHSRTDTGRHMRSEEQPFAPRNTPVGAHSGLGHSSVGLGMERRGISEEIGGVLERPSDLEEDPHAPKDVLKAFAPEKYQAKVTDPIGKGSEEVGVTPILHRLDRMHIHDESGGEQQQKHTTGQEESLFKPSLDHETEPSTDKKLFTGTHDQFSPEPITPETSTLLETPEPEPQALDTTRSTTQSTSSKSYDKDSEQNQRSYTEKVSSAASMVADKAKQATATVTSKLSEYSGGAQEGSVSSKVVAMLQENVGPVLEKVAEMGSTVASKVESGPRTEPELEQVKMPVDKGVSMKEYLAEKLKPSEEDRALSELITETLPLHRQREEPNETGHEDGGSGEGSPGKRVLDKIKDAASSLFGKGGESETQALSEGSKNDTSASGY